MIIWVNSYNIYRIYWSNSNPININCRKVGEMNMRRKNSFRIVLEDSWRDSMSQFMRSLSEWSLSLTLRITKLHSYWVLSIKLMITFSNHTLLKLLYIINHAKIGLSLSLIYTTLSSLTDNKSKTTNPSSNKSTPSLKPYDSKYNKTINCKNKIIF